METGSRLTVRAYHVTDVEYGEENRVTVDGEERKNGAVWKDYELDREYAFCLEDGGTVKESWTVVFLCSQNLPSVWVYTDSGSMDLVNEGVIANLSPGDEDAENCRSLGRLVAS